jgi:hypothetical protein
MTAIDQGAISAAALRICVSRARISSTRAPITADLIAGAATAQRFANRPLTINELLAPQP